MTDTIIVEGDTAPDLIFTLRNAGGLQNLTGASVELHLKAKDQPPIIGACSIDAPATAGVVRYERTGEEPAGRYAAEIVVTFFNETVETFPSAGPLSIIIRERST